MKVSICIATYNKPEVLKRVLESITRQQPLFLWEVIVVDDGSPTNGTEEVCKIYPNVRLIHRWRQPGYGNPAIARNIAYRAAIGDILICQSDDVVHANLYVIEQLVHELRPGRFVLASVTNTDRQFQPVSCGHPRNPDLTELCGPRGKRPLFFLGAVYRQDVYEIGGNDERFTTPGKEDIYFVDCLVKGLGLKPHFSTACGYHLHHTRPSLDAILPSDHIYDELVAEGTWQARGAPWSYSTLEGATYSRAP